MTYQSLELTCEFFVHYFHQAFDFSHPIVALASNVRLRGSIKNHCRIGL